jgi:hypothetical protein
MKKEFLVSISIVFISGFLLYGHAFSQDLNDPAISIFQNGEQIIDNTPQNRFTQEEFDALTDDEKRQVYYHEVHLLPENIDLKAYEQIFHPQ